MSAARSPDGEVVGWGQRAPWAAPGARSASRWLADRLADLGVRHAFGVLGGGIAPFGAGLAASAIRFFHTRHECGAAFAAVEAHFATERPTLVVATTGPGLFNALNGMMAARADGARVLLVSAATTRAQLGRGAVQETGPFTMPAGLTTAGPLFHFAAAPETIDELHHAVQQLACGWSRPGGFVAHLSLPWSLQAQVLEREPPPIGAWTVARATATDAAVDATLDALATGRAAIWLGHGARHAASELRTFALAAGLPVIGSPRAKGVFDEDHPLYLGTSGAGGHDTVSQFLASRPDTLLVLGTRLGEVTSFLAPSSIPSRRWIHVDIDPTAFGAAFPGSDGLGVVADVGEFVAALDRRARETGWYARHARTAPPAHAAHVGRPAPLDARDDGDVRPAYLMQVLQDRVVDRTAAIVSSEAGNSFTWVNHALRFAEPGRYRTSAAWGSMGHFTTGPVGAALAAGRRAVTVVGDGAMLMSNELNTAVAYRADVVWIVLNDAQLGLNHHGMAALGMPFIETQLPRTDFVAFARSQGAAGSAVEREADLAGALDRALATPGPVVVDVRIDPTV
ncbi:MAG TPA: thiamine pyrophosphate-dependent enzyme, partial [Kofleriaceae bacterium]|nr:thiamine pyrophosphate-dependent enzyme [Kofleriaceae bacterium]